MSGGARKVTARGCQGNASSATCRCGRYVKSGATLRTSCEGVIRGAADIGGHSIGNQRSFAPSTVIFMPSHGILGRCRRIARPLAAMLVLLLLPQGCAGWRAYAGPPSDVLTDGRTHRVRLHLDDGTVRSMVAARLVGDSIVGYGSWSDQRNGSPSAVALANVRSVDQGRVSVGRTLILLTVIGTLLVIAGWGTTSSGISAPGCAFMCGA